MSSNPNVPLAPLAAPAAPTIVGALDDATGLILASNATAPLTVRCKTGDFSDFDDFFVVEMADATQPLLVWVAVTAPIQLSATPIPIPDRFDITVPAPPGGFRHGFYRLRSVQYLNISGVPAATGEHSEIANFTVDLLSAYSDSSFRDQPFAILWPSTLPAGTPIDNTYLALHGGVMFQIPPNTFVPPPGQWADGDFITFYWSSVMFPRPQDIVSPAGGIPMLQTGNTPFFLQAAMIDVSGDFHAFYTITDRAGNVSRPSFIETRRVTLIADPDRGTPHLPLAPVPDPGETDDLINIRDYLLNPEVWVRTYNNHAPLLDRLEVDIGGLGYNGLGMPFTTFPQRFSNLQAEFRAAYTQAIGPQPTTLQYRISRNGTSFPSFIHTFMLDLSVGGPVNPGEPGSPNPNLNQAHVFGAGSTIPDVLEPAHADQQVRVDIAPWTVAELPHSGQSIIFLWEDERVGPFPVSATANPISFFIDWDVVARHGNNLKTIKYLVLDPRTENENESPPTTVDVQGAVVVELAKAQYVAATAGRWFCSDLKTRTPGTPPVLFGEVYVPGDPRMAVGVSLTLTLSLTNTYPGLPIGTFPVMKIHPSLTQPDIDNGITFEIDYMPDLAQAPRGTIVATYETVLSNGVTGHGEPSEIRSTLANTHFFCDGTNIPSP